MVADRSADLGFCDVETSTLAEGLHHEPLWQADVVLATGSRNNVHAAYSSGRPALGVGAGCSVHIAAAALGLSALLAGSATAFTW